MSSAGTAVFIESSPTLNHYSKFNTFHRKIQFYNPSFSTLKESSVVLRKSVRFKNTMASVSMETRFINGDHDEEHSTPTISGFKKEALINNGSVSYHQTRATGGLHTVLNRLSKWVVAVTFGGFIMLRHDDLALWAGMGSVTNFILSIALKRILKQERPVSDVSSGPGMPSSHAQSVFFSLVFVIMSVIEWVGLNGATTSLGVLLVALGSYFSWLRILLGYHTTSQVIAGTIVGSNYAVLWFWAWKAIIHSAYNSCPWVQILLLVGGASYCLGFISLVLWHFIKK